jgi:hypothetical protein
VNLPTETHKCSQRSISKARPAVYADSGLPVPAESLSSNSPTGSPPAAPSDIASDIPLQSSPSFQKAFGSDVFSEPSFPHTLASNVATQRSVLHSDTSSESQSNCSISDDDAPHQISSYKPIPPVSGGVYANIDLEDLIRGPKISLKIVDVVSPDTSEDEQELIIEVEEEERPSRDRRSKRKEIDSSDDEAVADTDETSSIETSAEDDQNLPLAIQAPSPPSREGSIPLKSFQAVDKQGISQEVDNSGNTAFQCALDEDTAVFELANQEAICSPDLPCCDTAKNPFKSALCTFDIPTQLTTETSKPSDSTHATEIVSDSNLARDFKVADIPRRGGMIQKMRGRSGKALGEREITNSTTPFSSQKQLGVNNGRGVQDSIARRTRSTMSLGLMTPPPQMLVDTANHQASQSTAVLPPMKPSVVQNRIGGVTASRFASSMEDASTKVLPETQSSSQKHLSLDTWATLKPSSPLPDADSTIMIDELDSSSPGSFSQIENAGRNMSANRHPSPQEPLFILTESQAPFPYSQWTGTIRDEDSQLVSNDSDDEDEVLASVQSQSQVKNTSKYRTLTDIASQRSMFATPTNLQPAPSQLTKHKLADLYGRLGAEESESDSNTDSDSNSGIEGVQEQSHIPKARRAGVIQKSK